MGEQTISYDEIGAVYLYNHSGGYRQDFNYLGYGKWGVKNYTARKQTESWAGSGETRHSFKMEINGTTYRWGHKEKDKGQPNLTTDNSYYNLYNWHWAQIHGITVSVSATNYCNGAKSREMSIMLR